MAEADVAVHEIDQPLMPAITVPVTETNHVRNDETGSTFQDDGSIRHYSDGTKWYAYLKLLNPIRWFTVFNFNFATFF